MNPFIIDIAITAHPLDIIVSDEAFCRALEAHYVDEYPFDDHEVAELFVEETNR